MSEKNKGKNDRHSYIFTKETFGMTLLLFSVIVFVMLFTGSSVFAGIGQAVCAFMYGTFGYGCILVMAVVAYCGEVLVFEKKLKIKGTVILISTVTTFCVFFLLHTVMTNGFSYENFSNYIEACYTSAEGGWAGYTFGGVVSALVVYPVAKYTTLIGAYVIFSVLIAMCGYIIFMMIRHRLPAREKEQPESEQALPARKVIEEAVATEQPVNAQDHLYSVNSDYEIVDNRVDSRRTTPVQPAPAMEASKPEDDEDRFSSRNLGRKILFENDEFAAESYRRNMIFSESSYFNHPVKNDNDYLSSFSSGATKPQQSAPEMSYTESYQQEVINSPVSEAPSNYVYGEKPVEHLSDEYEELEEVQSVAEEEYNSDEHNFFAGESQFDEQDEIMPDRERAEPYRSAPFVASSPRYVQPEEEEEKTEPDSDQPVKSASDEIENTFSERTYFSGESVRNEFMERGETSERRGERSNADLFDDDNLDDDFDVLGASVFGERVRPSVSESDRSENKDRTENSVISEPPASPREPVKGIGFSTESRREVRRAEEPTQKVKPAAAPVEKPKHVWKRYVHPTMDLLDDYPENNNVNASEIEGNKRAIVTTLEKYKIGSEVTNVTIGPAITRYDVIISDSTNIKRSLQYRDAIAMEMKKENVSAYLNYSKGALSIEVPNQSRSVVGLKSMLASQKFINAKSNSLTFGLGKNVEGEVICPDITKMPHLLVAGTTGSGKSICLSALLISLLYKYGPEELRLILVDPKQVEFISYDKLPHLMINEILYEVDKAIKALNWAIKEMERRYTLFKEMTENGIATKNLDEYNAHLPQGEEKLPKVVIVLDEFGDLMLQAKKDIESRIIKLVQKARACGIHLILATQRPSVDCITGLIKSNLPTRIGFKVNSFDDARTIFDIGGAEKLLGKGDMYFRSAENPDLTRIQGCFVDTHEVQRVTDFVKANNETYFDQEVSDFINKVEQEEAPAGASGDSGEDSGDAKIDDTFIKALKYCVTSNQASVSMIQRRFPVGYIKACKIIDWMENMNYITQSEGSKPRKVLMSMDEFINTYGDTDD